MTKILGILFVAIIAPLVIWYLTHPGGPLNPEDEGNPDLVVSGFEQDEVPAVSPQNPKSCWVSITVKNVGDAIAKECTISWYSLGKYSDTSPVEESFNKFVLSPGEEETQRFHSEPYSTGFDMSTIIYINSGDLVFGPFTKIVKVDSIMIEREAR